MKTYCVSTHVGEYTTRAVSAKKAIINIRFRLYGRGVPASVSWSWTAKEVEVAV